MSYMTTFSNIPVQGILRRRDFGKLLPAPLATGLSGICVADDRHAAVSDLPLPRPARRLVCFFLDGGLSHLESFDPKPEASESIRGEFETIKTSAPGVMFSEHWRRMAQIADRITVLRSVHHRHNEHGFAVRCMHCLQENASPKTPSVGAVVQWQSGARLPVHICLPDLPDYSGALGTQYRAFPVMGPVAGHFSAQAADNRGNLDTRFRRLALLNQIQSTRAGSNRRSVNLIEQQQSVEQMVQSPVYRNLVDLSQHSSTMIQRYGDTPEGQLARLAWNAVQQEMQYTVVNFGGWDMHTNLFQSSRTRIPPVDAAIAAFIEDLDTSGQLASTLVLVLTEFGRSPVVEGTGRGHWPRACSLIVAGGPVPRGQVVGHTGSQGENSETLRHTPDDLLASIYRWLNLDWHLMLPGEDARLNTAGSPIVELGLV
jgi:hypothetical protein